MNFSPERKFKHVIYKITFPNGKIYIGKDVGSGGHSIRYFGTWNREAVERDFTKVELADFSIRREIIFESEDKADVESREVELIIELESNNPERGYNQHPKFMPTSQI